MKSDPVASSVKKGILNACGTIFQIAFAIVMAIALLIVMVPVFSQAGSSAGAQRSENRGNIKQLSTAIDIYRSDYDNRFPIASTWQTTVSVYVKNEKMFHWSYTEWKGLSNSEVNGLFGFNSNISTLDDYELRYTDKLIWVFESWFSEGKNAVGKDASALRTGKDILLTTGGPNVENWGTGERWSWIPNQ